MASPVDWDRARRVAEHVARRRHPYVAATVLDPAIDTDPLEARIAAVTGLRAPTPVDDLRWVDRADWVRANISSFRHLLRPLLDRWPAERHRFGGITGTIAGTEVGLLLGWMSTRVLGQYDLLLGEGDGAAPGAVYLVEPNLAAVERRYGFDPRQFRTWVLLHELTHRAQFNGVPWMRDHFRSLVDEALGAVDPSPQAFVRAAKEAFTDRAEAQRRIRDNGLAGLVATPRQREVFARIAGLMSLLEGHGDVTMTRAAGTLVPDAEHFASVLAERRRQASPLAKLLQQLLGLEAKLDQYRAGERFIAEIEAEAGPDAVAACWEGPEHLPSLEEIREPQRWLSRLTAAR
jgi:coenzyme F420 biosynthesis associated uncharacterized protein